MPSYSPACCPNDSSRRDSPTNPARRVNSGSPFRGKRPRSRRHEEQKEEVTSAKSGDRGEKGKQGPPQPEDGEEEVSTEVGEEDAWEPFAKVARNEVCEELPKTKQHAELSEANGDKKDSKPPARKEEAKKSPSPLASNLGEFMKPGATKLFRPRPEWYLGDQNGNPNAAWRRGRCYTPVSPPGRPHFPVTAAALPFPLPLGLIVAPKDRPLPEENVDVRHRPAGSFDANFVDQPAFVLAQESKNQFPRGQQEQSPFLSTFGRDFDPALHVAIREAATEAALALLEWGATVKAENAKGVTPLMLASQKGNYLLVKELLRRGALPSKASSNGTTAVLQAAHFGHLECLELLFRAGGVSLIEMANFNDTTPLMRAAQEGHVSIVQMLLDRGASVNRRNRVQMTALMLASQRGHVKVCQVLVDKGAELDCMTAQHSTSLLLACKRGHVDVVRVLVTAGCELWVQDSRGRTAREVAQRRHMKDLVPLIDENVQLHLMQQQERRQRNYEMILLWNLLQRERAIIPLRGSFDEEIDVARQATIHQLTHELQQPKKLNLSMSPSHNSHLPPILPYPLSQKSTGALLRTMALPAPLVELIAKFMPLPPMWDRRLGMLTNRSVINADATVTCALDLIDEILEEGGFVEACDFAQVVPPTHFGSWRDWRKHVKCRCCNGGQVQLPDDHQRERPVATTAPVSKPRNILSVLEMRRQVGFLHVLANRTPFLAHVLANQPYNMPRPLIQQLITTSDIQSLVRRMGSRGVHFEPTVAMDLIRLVRRLCSWYFREREDTPYPTYPAVVHPPLPQPRQRVLPQRVLLDIVSAPFQYAPHQLQQSAEQDAATHERQSFLALGPI